MLLYDQLYTPSYKGVTFWFRSSTTSAGRKTVVHEFPQKDFRSVEDLGKELKTLEIKGIIKGALYLLEKGKLESALTSSGIGILIHPFYGELNVYCLGYEVTEEDSTIGVAHFTMRFAETQKSFSPRVTNNNTSFIANLYRELYSIAETDFSLEYTMKFINNIEDSVQAADRALSRMKALSNIAKSFLDGRNTFIKSLSSFGRDKYRIAQIPSDLSESYMSIISDFDNLTIDQQTRFDINKQSFGIGSSDDLIIAITPEIEERNKNRKLLNGFFNYLILNNLYSTASLIDYENDIQLDGIQNILNIFYNDLITNDNYLLTNNLIDKMSLLRNEIRKFFDAQRLTIAKVTTIKTQMTSAAVLSYQYYGSSDNYNEILELNDITNPAVISGDIRILEQ